MSGCIKLPGDTEAPRILYLARGVPHPGTLSGAQRRVTAFLGELDRMRIPTLAYTAQPRDPVETGSRSVGRCFVPLGVRGAFKDASVIVESARWASGELAVIRAFQPSVVLERASYLDWSGAKIARALAIPHVLELHGLLDHDARTYYRSLLSPMGKSYEGRRYRCANRTIVVSEGLRRHLIAHGVARERTAAIPNGTEAAPAFDPRVIATTRRRWGISDEQVVGWIGHLMLWQVPSFIMLIRALERLAREVRVTLVIVAPDGAGPRAVEAAGSAEVRVVRAGEAAGHDAFAAVAAFDVGVVPAARPYDLPVKLFQYGACGIPIVAPAAESIVALEGSDSLNLFEPDVDSLAKVLRAAIRMPEAATRASRFRRLVEERYLWKHSVEQTLELLRTI